MAMPGKLNSKRVLLPRDRSFVGAADGNIVLDHRLVSSARGTYDLWLSDMRRPHCTCSGSAAGFPSGCMARLLGNGWPQTRTAVSPPLINHVRLSALRPTGGRDQLCYIMPIRQFYGMPDSQIRRYWPKSITSQYHLFWPVG